ncbi:hypothetical protein FHX49_000649 [Microbacterium endophyticum]|uniref:Uncharacterized protein n=1 Tax=Microbacterium endophyticum TaxID=1526412 RepID=A0A7W4V2R9_9MICO|nr:hypothetical protein [Microbacterium endophyticum]NIK37352.1 hypothetical protein [Microbacterium endophyticum]
MEIYGEGEPGHTSSNLGEETLHQRRNPGTWGQGGRPLVR